MKYQKKKKKGLIRSYNIDNRPDENESGSILIQRDIDPLKIKDSIRGIDYLR